MSFDLNDPFARLLRLRGAISEVTPIDATRLGQTDAGLVDIYNGLRDQAESLCRELGIDEQELQAQLVPIQARVTGAIIDPHEMMEATGDARKAAASLRAMGGYIGGILELVMIHQKIDASQVEAAREASRPKFGFQGG